MFNKNLLAAVAATLALSAGSAMAATKTANFNVTAAVAANCFISATNLAFGNYLQEGGNIDASSTLTVRCSSGTPYAVALSAGGSGSTANRAMSDGTNSLRYNLYTDALRTTVWGATGTDDVDGTGAGLGASASQSLPVYGRLPDSAANQLVPVGNYSDSITATITY
jgi:spore coat protein U-like protein